jgi:outer membrane protein assembly factor BamB
VSVGTSSHDQQDVEGGQVNGRQRLLTAGLGLVLLVLASACQNWTQYMGDPGLTGNDAGENIIGPSNVASLHEVDTVPLPGSSHVVYSPVVSGGMVYAGTDDGHLIAASANPATCPGTPKVCHPLWTASLSGFDTASAPVVSNGLLYDVFLNSEGSAGVLAAFDASGAINCSGAPKICLPEWTAPAYSLSGVNVDGGRVFVDDLAGQQLEAFDAQGLVGCSGGVPRTCVPEWTASIHSFGVPSVANGQVYVPTFDTTPAYVGVYDEAGAANCAGSPVVCQPLFTVPLPESSTGSVDVSNGVGYVETDTHQPTNSHLVAFDAAGVVGCAGSPLVCQPEWTALLSGGAHFVTPAASNGRVYAPSDTTGAVLDVFDAAGNTGCTGVPKVCTRLVTTPTVAATADEFGSPVVTNGLVFEKGAAYSAVDTSHCTGGVPIVCSALWTAPVTSRESGSIVADATVFVGGDDHAIHAYQVSS